MVLDELSGKQLDKINKMLKSMYGMTISENTSIEKLYGLYEEISGRVENLKAKGHSINESPELAKYLLITEGVGYLLKGQHLSESSQDCTYFNLICGMACAVVENVAVGDEVETAISLAMREYRSSFWRFPETRVESDLRVMVDNKLSKEMDEALHYRNVPRSKMGDRLSSNEQEVVLDWITEGTNTLPSDIRSKLISLYSTKQQIPSKNQDEWLCEQLTKDLSVLKG